MIRHIVAWRLKAEDAEAKAEAVASIAAVLEPLAGVVPGILRLEVRANMAYFEKNWDVVLVGDYESLDVLDAYQRHPDHVAAGAVVLHLVSDRASIDVEA